jgi:hypothetical protein
MLVGPGEARVLEDEPFVLRRAGEKYFIDTNHRMWMEHVYAKSGAFGGVDGAPRGRYIYMGSFTSKPFLEENQRDFGRYSADHYR